MKDQATKEKFIELRGAQGLSYDKIATRLKTSKQTLITWAREYEYDIANLKQIQLDTIREKYRLTKENQIELLGEGLKKVRDEIGRRDMKGISTDKLLSLLLKFNQEIREETTAPVFRTRETISDLGGIFSDMQTVHTWQG